MKAAMFGLAFCACLVAGPIRYEGSGTFSADTPLTEMTAPGGNFSFSFVIQEPLVLITPVTPISGVFFSVIPAELNYYLNGVAVPVPPFVGFYSGSQRGMFVLCWFNCTPALRFQGPQMYTGTELNPTLVTGTFTSTRFLTRDLGSTLLDQANITVTATLVPEPRNASLVCVGLLLFARIALGRNWCRGRRPKTTA